MNFLETASLAADAAKDVLCYYWKRKREVHSKSCCIDLVTQVDKEAEAAIVSCLKERHPEHGILAEESGGDARAPYLWVVDPLDGTTNYVHGLPLVAVSIALIHQGQALTSIVDNPIMEERFTAERGSGAHLNGESISVSKCEVLEKSLLVTGFPYDRRERSDNNYREFCHFTNLTQGVRRLGAAALDLAFVAAGRFDGYWEKGLNAWDISAGALIVEEAGGQVSGYGSHVFDPFSGEIVASNGLLHSHIINGL